MRFREVALAFGRVLREERLRKGLSQEVLALRCNFNRTYPSLLERGLRTPTLWMIFRLSAALEVDPSFLVAAVQDELSRPQ